MTDAALAIADWGTTSFRIWLLDPAGNVLAERRSAEGMQALERSEFASVLGRHLDAFAGRFGAFETGFPVMICGMAGSRQGWCEAPYAAVPVRLDALPERAVPAPDLSGVDVRILPGIARKSEDRPDVMRGEETQLMGLCLQTSLSGTVVMPGTHSKWVRLEAGEVVDFATAMTGELFAVLAGHSILRHSLAGEAPSSDSVSDGFQRGLDRAIQKGEGLSKGLFALRGEDLLLGRKGAELADELSGLLIGMEVADMLRPGAPGAVTLVASGPVASLYTEALKRFEIKPDLADADSLVRRGLQHAARTLWPSRFSENS